MYANAVDAVQNDELLYDALSLIDSIRVGKVREKELAIKKLRSILNQEYAY